MTLLHKNQAKMKAINISQIKNLLLYTSGRQKDSFLTNRNTVKLLKGWVFFVLFVFFVFVCSNQKKQSEWL